MRALIKLIGLALVIAGIYFLSRNIMLTTVRGPFFWRGIAAYGSVLLTMGGIMSLLFLPRRQKQTGWIMLIAGIILVFLSSRAVLSPTSLWNFMLAFAAFAGGYRMMTSGRISF